MSEKEAEKEIKANGKPMEKNDLPEEAEVKKDEKFSEEQATSSKPEKECKQSEEPVKEDPQKKLTEIQSKYNELNDKYLRLYSDFDNFRKRSARERIDLIKYSEEELIASLLPVLDDLERAIRSNENSKEIKVVKEGIQLIFQKFKNILNQKGLKEMEIKDGIFNSDEQEAITKIPVEDNNQKGKVIDVIEKGYLLNEKIIRHAKVVVGD